MEKELEKKIIRKGIFIFLIVGTIFGSIAGVTAYTISAKEIGYSPKDTSWKVNNVADAIESLKTLKGGSQNYSLDEQVVGTWIDGKPIYQKTFTNLSIAFSWNSSNKHAVATISPLLTNYEHVVGIWGLNSTSNVFLYINFSIEGSSWKLMTFTGNSVDTLTIQYTKTTDNATNS